jgi:hypothetical protein
MITQHWDDESRTIMVQVFGPTWTWDEVFETWQETQRIVEADGRLGYEFDFILDMLAVERMPGQFFTFFRRETEMAAEVPVGLRVVVGANAGLRAFWNLFLQVSPAGAEQFHLMMARTHPEAREIIARYRAEHPYRVPGDGESPERSGS